MNVFAAAARQAEALEMNHIMLMDESIKVTLAYKAGQQHVTKL